MKESKPLEDKIRKQKFYESLQDYFKQFSQFDIELDETNINNEETNKKSQTKNSEERGILLEAKKESVNNGTHPKVQENKIRFLIDENNNKKIEEFVVEEFEHEIQEEKTSPDIHEKHNFNKDELENIAIVNSEIISLSMGDNLSNDIMSVEFDLLEKSVILEDTNTNKDPEKKKLDNVKDYDEISKEPDNICRNGFESIF